MIIDLQRRLAEIGRIRIGQQVTSANGKSRPAKLDTFRLTSADRNRIQQAAQLYGGAVSKWAAPAGQQYEVITTADALPVIVPPADMAFSQNYELWAAGGCQRRCDGVTEDITEGPCLCDPDARDCNIHSRLSVMLRDLPGLGVWRIDTQGYYAAVELQGAVEIIRVAAGRGQMLPATLRLEQRMTKRAGETTKRYAVPVLDIEVSPGQLIAGAAAFDAGTIAIEPPPIIAGTGEYASHNPQGSAAPLTPVPAAADDGPPSVADQIKPKPRKRRAGSTTVPATGLAPRTAAQVGQPLPAAPDLDDAAQRQLGPDDDVPETRLTPKQLRRIQAQFTSLGVTDSDNRHTIISYILGIPCDNTGDLGIGEASKVIDRLVEWYETAEPPIDYRINEILNAAALREAEQIEK